MKQLQDINIQCHKNTDIVIIQNSVRYVDINNFHHINYVHVFEALTIYI